MVAHEKYQSKESKVSIKTRPLWGYIWDKVGFLSKSSWSKILENNPTFGSKL